VPSPTCCVVFRQVCWAGPHTLATAADSDGSIRLLQLDTGDNYMLDLKDARFIRSDSDTQAISASANAAEGLKSGVTCLAYEPMTNLLAAGTSDGQVYTFRRGGNSAADSLATEPAKQWEPQNRFLVRASCHVCSSCCCMYPQMQPCTDAALCRGALA
jgi:intraflagellar transport protein 140